MVAPPAHRLPRASYEHLHAGRVLAGLVLPGALLLAVGRPDLIIYAVFGSFTGMYGRAECRRLRLRHQLHAAGMMVTTVGIGIALSYLHADGLFLVAAVVVFSTVGSLVIDRLGLRPEGPFFGIFALGAIAAVPAGHVAPWKALAISAATALACVAVGRIGSRPCAGTCRTAPALPPDGWLQAVRYGSATALAGGCGLLLGVGHLNWALAGAAVPLAAADARSRVYRGMHRVAGTFAGLGVTALLLLPHPSTTTLAVIVIALLFPTELYLPRHYGVAIGFFTPLVMLTVELADPIAPAALLADRIVGTLIGVASGVVVAVLVRGRE